MIVYFRKMVDLQGYWIDRDYKAGIGQIIGIGNGQGYRQSKDEDMIVDLVQNFRGVKDGDFYMDYLERDIIVEIGMVGLRYGEIL